MNATVEQVAQRSLRLIRDRHRFEFAVVHAVYEAGGDDDDFRKVLPVLQRLLKNDHALRFIYRKITRALEGSSEPEEFQTCFHQVFHAAD